MIVLQQEPEFANAWLNLGITLRDMGAPGGRIGLHTASCYT